MGCREAVGSVLKRVCSVLATICVVLKEIGMVGTAVVRESGRPSIRYKGVYRAVERWMVSRVIVGYERAVKTTICEGPIVGRGSPWVCYILREMSMNDVIYEQINSRQKRKTVAGTRSCILERLRLVGRKNPW